MTKIQRFSYHSHTNSFGIFDGKNSSIEMIKKAEEIGYTELGISNHICYHHNMPKDSNMFFNNFSEALDVYKRNIDEIRQVSELANIKVLVGFEVDFFPSVEWRSDFEKMLKTLDVDYLIGSTHFIRDNKEDNLVNLYRLEKYKDILDEETKNQYLINFWDNLVESIKSGYFSFIAHPDVCKVQGLCLEEKWNDYKFKVIETLDKYKHPYELNTSGLTKVGEFHPHKWMIEELNKRNVPILINDDAHSVEQLGAHYEVAEDLLAELNYKNRWKIIK